MTKVLLSVLFGLTFASAAEAGPILDKIRAEGVLRCGAVERPGLFTIEANGKANGLLLDICRAITAVALGPKGRLEFRRYDSEKAFGALRDGVDDVAFLTAREMIDNRLTGKLIPGPTVFIESSSILVPETSPVQHVADLAGKPICFALLQRAQNHLSDWFETRHLDFIRMGFQEDVEMNDAYRVHYCQGLAGETTTLADAQNEGALAKNKQRLLPEILAAYPIVAATGVKDGEWSALVAWTIDTLIRADAPGGKWTQGGVESLPVFAPELGLAEGWQKKVVGMMGSYGAMFDRNLGEKTELKLPRGPNRPLSLGGFLDAPYSE